MKINCPYLNCREETELQRTSERGDGERETEERELQREETESGRETEEREGDRGSK